MITQSEIQYTPYYGSTPLEYVYWGNALIWQKTETPITDPYEGYDMVLEFSDREPNRQYGVTSYKVYGEIGFEYKSSTSKSQFYVGFLNDFEEEPSLITKCVWSDKTKDITVNFVRFIGYYSGSGTSGSADNIRLKKVIKFPDSWKGQVDFYCPNLEYLNWKGNSLNQLTTSKCTNLTDLECDGVVTKNLFFFNKSPLTNKSADNIIKVLGQTTENLKVTFSSTTYSTLTQEQLALATSKGWTVASA